MRAPTVFISQGKGGRGGGQSFPIPPLPLWQWAEQKGLFDARTLEGPSACACPMCTGIAEGPYFPSAGRDLSGLAR